MYYSSSLASDKEIDNQYFQPKGKNGVETTTFFPKGFQGNSRLSQLFTFSQSNPPP